LIYCIDVEPGKYKIDFNWKREIEFDVEPDEDGEKVY